jgi:4-hydroxybenzoate polyprenyltransferase
VHFGGKFWLKLIGGVIACAIATVIIFIVLGSVWYSWGFLGALVVLAIVFGTMGWMHDKRERKRLHEAPAP